MSESGNKRTPKTGLAGRMRDWMKTRAGRAFAPRDLADGLNLSFGRERDVMRNTLTDFLARGELLHVGPGKYRYNRQWGATPRVAALEGTILKAVYLSGQAFTAADILRLTEAGDRSYVTRILRRLIRQGHLLKVGERAVRQGKEHVYRVMDRQRFRVEVLP